MEKRHDIPKEEMKAMINSGSYPRKVISANYEQDLSLEAEKAACTI